MSPVSTLTSLNPTATPGGNQHPAGPGYQRGLPFWPILFGVILIALVGGLWKWKSKLGISSGPISNPKPPTIDTEMARHRGAPIHGRPSATVQAPPPPPPAYIYPPRYDNTPPPYAGGVRPS